jgi:alpha-1,3-mannosyltransferase
MQVHVHACVCMFVNVRVCVLVDVYVQLTRARTCLRSVKMQVDNWVICLLCLSKRVHSIFMLRLFNDGIAMLIFYVAVWLLIERRYVWANVCLSLAVSQKMNILVRPRHAPRVISHMRVASLNLL